MLPLRAGSYGHRSPKRRKLNHTGGGIAPAFLFGAGRRPRLKPSPWGDSPARGGNVCEADKGGPSPAGKGGLARRAKTDEVEAQRALSPLVSRSIAPFVQRGDAPQGQGGLETYPALPFSVAVLVLLYAPLKERGRYFFGVKKVSKKPPLIPGQRTHGLRGPYTAPLRNPHSGRPG